MIYITGDTHGDPLRFTGDNMGDGAWTSDDYLIVCGDFGYVFFNSLSERDFLDYLETKPYTVCFCDGNHENFPAIYAYPQEEWHGGQVHRIRSNVIHLMRGQVYDIDGRTVFAMGGAYSIDRAWRQLNVTYWEEELPSGEDYHEAARNLKEHRHKVDIIVSHTAPAEIIRLMRKYPDVHEMELTGFLDWVMYETAFGHWYFGHWHLDESITDRVTAVYNDVHAV